MHNRINILYITLSLDVGGLEVLLLELINKVNRAQYNPFLCVLQNGGALVKEFTAQDIPVYHIPKKKGIDYLLPFKIRELIKDNNINIVHTHNSTPWIYGGIAAKLVKGVHLVHTKHSNLDLKQKRLIKVEKWMSKVSDCIIADAQDVRDFMIKKQGIARNKIKLIYNGIDYNKFNCVDRQRFDSDSKKIGIIARLVPVKDHKTLLSAFKIVNQRIPETELLIVGDGELKQELINYSDNLGIGEKVFFLGNRRDVPELLKIMDVFVLSSISEGLPITILEAMAAGVPVVATDVGGNKEVVVHEETGLLVPERDTKRLAEAIIIVLKDKKKANFFSENGLIRVKQIFSLDRMVEEYARLYEEHRKKRNMKALIITNLYPNPIDPLRGIFIANMVKMLKEKCEVILISPLPWFPRHTFFKGFIKYYYFSQVPEESIIEGITVYYPKYLAIPKMGVLQPIFIFITIFLKTMRIVRQKKIDLINAHWVYPDGVAASWVARLLKKPFILSARGCDINLYSTFKLRKPQIKNALNKAFKVTTMSEKQKNVVEGLGIQENKVMIIKNGVDFERFGIKDKEECRNIIGLNDKDKIILFVGQIIEVKGLTYLIEAIKKMKDNKLDEIKVKIIGEGNLRTGLENRISELGLQGFICFVGKKSREEIPQWFGACDLLCLPSIREGCPNVILEALASGRPVVASKVGGIPELVNENNGVLFEKGNVEQLANALTMASEREWDSQIIQDTIKEYTWERIANQFLNVYKEALSKERKP